MKRHAALLTLSREHHTALVLALACSRAAGSGSTETMLAASERVAQQFDAELEPHFRREEQTLLPLLQQAGLDALVRRTLSEHAHLRALARSLCARDTACLAEFAQALSGHVRFEEQELFPAAEQAVPEQQLMAALGAD